MKFSGLLESMTRLEAGRAHMQRMGVPEVRTRAGGSLTGGGIRGRVVWNKKRICEMKESQKNDFAWDKMKTPGGRLAQPGAPGGVEGA